MKWLALLVWLLLPTACDGLRERSGATRNGDLQQKNAEDAINRKVGEAMSEILGEKILPPSPAPSYPKPRGTSPKPRGKSNTFAAAANQHHAETERWRKEASVATGDDAEVNKRVCAVLEILEKGYKNESGKCILGEKLCRTPSGDELCGLIAIQCEGSLTRRFKWERLIERAGAKYGCTFFGPSALLLDKLEAALAPSDASLP